MTEWVVDEPQEADFARWRELYRGYADFYEVAQTEEQAARVWSWLPLMSGSTAERYMKACTPLCLGSCAAISILRKGVAG